MQNLHGRVRSLTVREAAAAIRPTRSALMNERQSNLLRDRIEDEIVTGAYRPGDRLDEASLATRFGVSRTPIREALQQLAVAGLVDVRRHRGAIVSAPDPKRLIDMFEMMAEIEAICGRLAARRLLPEDERALTEALEACRKASEQADPDVYYYENERFHRAIYAASGNPSWPSRRMRYTAGWRRSVACSCASVTASRPRRPSTKPLSRRSSAAKVSSPPSASTPISRCKASASPI